MVPELEEWILSGGQAELIETAKLVSIIPWSAITPYFADCNSVTQIQKGVSSARSDNTKGLKGAILDWIVPHGQYLYPPIACNIKIDCGFNHECTGALLCPANMDWSDPELVPCPLTLLICGDSVKDKLCNGEVLIAGNQWPIFLYAGYKFDPKEPWMGLLRSTILVSVRMHTPLHWWTDPSCI